MSDVFANAFPATPAAADYPAESDVRFGVDFDNTNKTGTAYIPAASDVRFNVAVSQTVGSAYIPAASDVRLSVPVDATTGTLNVYTESNQPSEVDVRNGTGYADGRTGTCNVPSPDDVRLSTAVDATVGNCRVPTADKVELNYLYDTNDTIPGTLDPGATGTIPDPVNVRFGVSVGVGDTGTLVVPAESDVRSPVAYDGGVQAKTGSCVVPSSQDVQSGVAVDVSPAVGTFESPLASKVEATTPYGHAGEFTGTLDIDARANLPAVETVLDTVTYGVNSDINGTYHAPLQNEVWNAATFGPGNATTGTNRLPFAEDVDSTSGNYGPDDTITPALVVGAPCDYPSFTAVRKGVVYNNSLSVGDLVVPSVEEVEEGVLFDTETLPGGGLSGTLKVPDVADVRDGELYGGDSLLEGTLDPFAEANLPSTSNVKDGIAFGNALTGIFEWPDEPDVREGVLYGASGEFEGTLTVGAGTPVYPSQNDVRLGSPAYGTEGVLQFAGNCRVPPKEKVEEGYMYDTSDTVEGSLVAQVCCYPSEENVKAGVKYGCSDEYVGQWTGQGGAINDVGWIG